MNRETKNKIAMWCFAIAMIWFGAVLLAGMMVDDIEKKIADQYDFNCQHTYSYDDGCADCIEKFVKELAVK
jgi:hypothetical protein